MEEQIIKIIADIIYKSEINNMYDKQINANEVTFPLQVTREKFYNLPFNVIIDFNELFFKNFKNILLENAICHAIENNDAKYLNFIKDNKDTIKDLLDKNTLLQVTTTNYGVKYIYTKLLTKKDNTELIKKNNPEYFNIINDYIVITNLYRNLALNMIEIAKNKNEELSILELLLYTETLDHVVLSQFSFITKDNINSFKYVLKRIILADNYLYNKSLEIDNDNNRNIEDENFDDYNIEEYENEIDENILDYIYNCVDEDTYDLPKDNDLRYKLYSTFIEYNLHLKSRPYDLENLKVANKILEFKKINPFYYLENIK